MEEEGINEVGSKTIGQDVGQIVGIVSVKEIQEERIRIVNYVCVVNYIGSGIGICLVVR